MEDEVYRNALVGRDELQALSRRSDWPGLLHLAAHFALIAALAALATGGGRGAS